MRRHSNVHDSHRCSHRCLGPLFFDPSVRGARITLSGGCRRAQREGHTFRDGLVFTNRTVQVQERVRLCVEGSEYRWQGALRVGFTTLHPGTLAEPRLPSLACPDLEEHPGVWAGPVPEECVWPGTELEFWVSRKGWLQFQVIGGPKYVLLHGVDISRPLWGVVDLYGQTRILQILGSVKKTLLVTQKSCPAPPLNPLALQLNFDYNLHSHDVDYELSDDGSATHSCSTDGDEDCSVCYSRGATMLLSCGHQCLCLSCAQRVRWEFGCCPLCREPITNMMSVGHTTQGRQES
ncbi:E3 ubiquitin-protein ligase NEURL3 [Amia ocellicauda]|uniref:E3 ubiquitin-protein ligase NEURL3 n=1 Tax=Amia ocellicauda TaxID=2972642 RepID=UPI0034643D84